MNEILKMDIYIYI